MKSETTPDPSASSVLGSEEVGMEDMEDNLPIELTNRIGEIFRESGLTQEKFAAKLGVNLSTLSNYLLRKRRPSVEFIVRLCNSFDVSPSWLLLGRGSAVSGGPGKDARFFFVPVLESRVTAGPEGELLCENVSDSYPFQHWWIERLVGKDPHRQESLRLVRIRGDSMTPTINPGEMALVDTGEAERTKVRPGKIYLVRQPDGGVAVKRLVLNENPTRPSLVCMSDNPSFQPFAIEIEADKGVPYYVLGRIRWVGKEID